MINYHDNLYDYPTKEEYLIRKHEIQEQELHSERFARICKFLENNYWNRENIDLEEKLFSIVETYGIEDHLINKPNLKIRQSRFQRYKKLQEFLSTLDLKTISSNIFLTNAFQLVISSYSHCVEIYNELLIQISNTMDFDDKTKKFEISWDIPKILEEFIPLRVQDCVGIPYYRPQDYKVSYIDILDKEHKYVYQDYNKYVDKSKKLAEDIYLLQMNLLTNSFPGELFNSCFEFETPDSYKQIIATYYLKLSDILENNGIQEVAQGLEQGTVLKKVRK